MTVEIDKNTGEKWIIHDREEIMYAFLAQCVEGLADSLNTHYSSILDRLEKVNLTEGYILRHYDVLHTESWENVIDELSDLLLKRESIKSA